MLKIEREPEAHPIRVKLDDAPEGVASLRWDQIVLAEPAIAQRIYRRGRAIKFKPEIREKLSRLPQPPADDPFEGTFDLLDEPAG